MYVHGTSVPALTAMTKLMTQEQPFQRLPSMVPPAVAAFQAPYTRFIQAHLLNPGKRFITEITCPTTQQSCKEVK